MLGLLHFLGRQLTTISLICAFVSLGFAHKDIPTPMAPELAAFVAAGGSISDICGGDHEPEHGEAVDCEACRITDTFAILHGVRLVASVRLERVQTWRFVAKRLSEKQRLDPARLTRAPPFV